MKTKKKRKKDTTYKYNNKKSVLILVMLICAVVAMITYWIYAYHHKYGDLYFHDGHLVSYKISAYLETKGDIIHLKNIDETIINDFVESQNNIINNNNIISTDIKKGLYDNILSVMINYTLNNNSNNYEEILSLNIDLKNNKLITNDEMLAKVKSSYKNIATTIFNEHIKLPSDSNLKVTDRITEETLTAKEFNDNSEKYIIRIREKLPDITKIYIEDDTVYYIVNLFEIEKVCYYTNNENRLVNIKKEIGKI